MTVPTIFDTCRPRPDVLDGTIADADFAADLALVLSGKASAGYRDAVPFFANTYPTRGLKNLLANVCRRLSGSGDAAAAIFRLDTSYGGGKTHGLIALSHAAKGMDGVPHKEEFVEPSLLPTRAVRIAAFDGENADPVNGRSLDGGVLAYTPWGEIAHALAGKPGYERVRESDELRTAPGAETLRALFGGKPTLILLDELSVYLRKVSRMPDARGQLTAFLTSLYKAVETAPNAALVYTLAIGKGGLATDAYSEENQFVADQMAEIEKVSARKATLLNPTEEDETVQVLRRRLFESVDDAAATTTIDAYQKLWAANQEVLSSDAARTETAEEFRVSYPLHPDVLQTLTSKTATLSNFQRVRGMLRLLARTVSHLWMQRPADATAIHVHHIDPSYEPIRQEIITRLGQSAFQPAITNDVAAGRAGQRSLAEEIDAEKHKGLPSYAAYVARTIFMHTLAFNKQLQGLTPEELRYSAVGPSVDLSFIDKARKDFITESAYLDDRPASPMRFLAEANLSQIIRREEKQVDATEARAQLNDRITEVFSGTTFEIIRFPGGPFDVPDDVGDGRPRLVVFAYDGVSVGETVDEIPGLIGDVHQHKGVGGSALRVWRNHLVLVAADDAAKDPMQRRMRVRLALQRLKAPDRLRSLAAHQQETVLALESKSEQELAVAVQQCYRHVFYPSRDRLGTKGIDLAHTAVDMPSASAQPGNGQRQIARALRDLKKLRFPDDEPDAPNYVRDRTPLRKGEMTTRALRNEFRRDPKLPILLGDDIYIRGIRLGIQQGDYVYKRGDLMFGPGEPSVEICIDEQALVMTMAYAKKKGVWPRPEPPGPSPPSPSPPGPPPPGPPPPPPPELSAEGVLKDALSQLWEKARANGVDSISALTIRMFEPSDAFRLLSAVGGVSDAEKVVTFEGSYETRDGGTFEWDFRGPVPDAQPVKEFLDAQMRVAESKEIKASFVLDFGSGLTMNGDAAEKLAGRLCRFVSGAAHVAASGKDKT